MWYLHDIFQVLCNLHVESKKNDCEKPDNLAQKLKLNYIPSELGVLAFYNSGNCCTAISELSILRLKLTP